MDKRGRAVKRQLGALDYLKHLKEFSVGFGGGLGTLVEGSCFRK